MLGRKVTRSSVLIKLPPLSTNSPDSYHQLRSWYLARLRKSSLTSDANSSLTPASLIRRDRDALEKLISRSADQLSASNQTTHLKTRDFFKFAREHASVLASIVFIIFADLIGLAWLLTAIPSHASHVSWIIGALLLLSCGVAITLSFAFYQLFATLSAVTEHEQAIADYALDAFWSFDENLNFTAVSPATKRLWGYDPIDLMGTNVRSLVVANNAELVDRQFAAAKHSKFPVKMEGQISRRDRSVADIELTAEYSTSALSFFCVIADVTERKDAERYKQQVMQILSHDLKSPLTALQFSLALIAKGKYGALSEDGEKMALLGEKNIDRLIGLINQMLDLPKMESNKLDLTLSDAKLQQIINDAVESVRSFADQKKTAIEIDCAEISISVDQDRLFQVFVNLIANAIKYTPNGSRIIVTGKTLPGDWLVEVRVTDNGAGIEPEHQAHIFDQFYRVQSQAQTTDGTGLGLAICKAIMEAHGGKIGVDSKPGAGASFWCHLPARAGN
jgi:PAS domain S-box-containing protein